MTSFINDNGEYLEYNGPDVSLTKQVTSVFSFQIKGDFSQNFTLDNNEHNRSVLGYQSAMQVNNPAFSQNTFTLIRNGNRLVRGFIIIQSIDINDIDCFFLAGNAAWFNRLQTNIKELDYDEFTTLYNSGGSNEEGICFPDVDWGYNGNKRGSALSYFIFTEGANNSGQTPTFVLSDQYPCVFLHSIVSKIASGIGIKIEGNVLQEQIYKRLIITPKGPSLRWPSSQTEPFFAYTDLASNFDVDNGETIIFETIVSSGSLADYNTATGIYTARKTATYKIFIDVTFTVADSYELYLRKNGATNTIIFPDTLGTLTRYSGTFYYNMVKGDYVELKVQSIGVTRTVQASSKMNIEISEEIEPISNPSQFPFISPFFGITNYVHASSIVPNMKAVDLIKFIALYFNCICVYDLDESKITLTKLNSITSEEDWSDYYVSHEETYNRGVAENNYVLFPETSEASIVRYNEINKTPYGGGNIQTEYNTKKEATLYTSPFGPAFDQPNKTALGGIGKPFIEFFRLSDTPDIIINYTSVVNNAGSAEFNHTGTGDATHRRVYRIISSSGIYSGFGVNNSNMTGSPSTSTFYGLSFVRDDTGSLVPQSAEKVESSHRILYLNPGGNTCWFDKPVYDNAIDNVKVSLAISSINGRSHNHSISEMFYSRLKTSFNSPVIKMRLLLPEAVYQNYNFDSFIRINTKNLSGRFFVNKISSYVSAKKECLVELIFV